MEYKSRVSKYGHRNNTLKDEENNDELLRKREELRRIVFNDDMDEDFIKLKLTGKPTGTYVVLSILFVLVLAFTILFIFFATLKENELYYIINAIFILIIFICYLISFKQAFMKKRVKATLINSFIIFIFLLFNTLCITNVLQLPKQSVVPNFYDNTIKKGLKWADDNNIKVSTTYEYSDDIKENKIISQNIKSDSLVSKTKSISFIVSLGVNPYKEVNLNNMTGQDINKVIKTIKKKKLNNVIINYIDNGEINKDSVISQNVSGTINRNTEVVFNISYGNDDNSDDKKMIDLYNKSYLDAILFCKRNKINYETNYEFSSNIEKGYVISTSKEEGTVLSNSDTVTLTISKGVGINVPDFTYKSEDMVLKNCSKLGIKCLINYAYDENNKEGIATGQSISEGTMISKDERIIINITNKVKTEL